MSAEAKAREKRAAEAFTTFDVNRDDSIDENELDMCLQNLGYEKEFIEANLQRLLQEHDQNTDGKLNLDEFIVLFNVLQDSLGGFRTRCSVARDRRTLLDTPRDIESNNRPTLPRLCSPPSLLVCAHHHLRSLLWSLHLVTLSPDSSRKACRR